MGNCCAPEDVSFVESTLHRTLQEDDNLTPNASLSDASPLSATPKADDLAQAKIVEAPATKGAEPPQKTTATPAAEPSQPAATTTKPAEADNKVAHPVGSQDHRWEEFLAEHPNYKPQKKLGSIPRRPSTENITYQQYTEKHKALFDRVLELEKPDGWVFKQEVSGINVYTKAEPGCPLLYFKGVGDVKVESLAVLVEKLFATEERPKWDEMCKVGVSPQIMKPYYKYLYVALRPPAAFIAHRDMCGIGRLRFESKDCVVAAVQSVEHPDFPETSEHVRINFMEGGYVLRDNHDGTFKVTWTGCVDPKGWLPTWIANLACAKQALTLAKLRQHINPV